MQYNLTFQRGRDQLKKNINSFSVFINHKNDDHSEYDKFTLKKEQGNKKVNSSTRKTHMKI